MKEYCSQLAQFLEQVKNFGNGENKVAPNGTFQIMNIPKMAPFAYLHYVFPPLKQNEIDKLSVLLGKAIPPHLVDLMGACNGLSLFAGELYLYGYVEKVILDADVGICQPFSIDIPNIYEKPEGSADEDIYIGGLASNGHHLYTKINDERVWCRSSDNEAPIKHWDSYTNLLESEFERLKLEGAWKKYL